MAKLDELDRKLLACLQKDNQLTADALADQFEFVMIKPSHYDDDGYPIVWWRGLIPSNSLAALNGLAATAPSGRCSVPTSPSTADRDRRDQPPCRSRAHRARPPPARVKALIGLVGVQSNQYDRALDLAREFRAAGLPVMIGGFHVSGCLSMLKEMPAELQEALDIGCSLFAGECEEGRLDLVLRDAWNGILKPIYNYLKRPAEPRRSAGAGAPRRRAQAATSSTGRASTSAAAARSSAASARSSTSRAARAASAPRTISRRYPREFRPGDQGLLHHRRQSRPQQALGGILRPADPAAREEGLKANLTIQVDTLCHRSRTSSTRPSAPARCGCSSGSRTSTRTTSSPPTSARTRSPNIATCCSNGTSAASSPSPATSSASPPTPRNRSSATSRSSSASCRSTCSNSSS
jgi:hypothetical protein